MSIFRKAYSLFGALLMLQFLLQLYFIAGAIFTIVNANDNAKDIYVAFKNADRFASLHVANGYLIGFTILIMVALSFASRYPWRTTIMTAVDGCWWRSRAFLLTRRLPRSRRYMASTRSSSSGWAVI